MFSKDYAKTLSNQRPESEPRRRQPVVALGMAAAMALADLSAGFAQPQPTPSPAEVRALDAYASAKDSARLPDGRTIHLTCMGQGGPVVVLTAGAGDWSEAWYKVQPMVAEKTRVCAWDRSGFGLSSPPHRALWTVDKRTSDLQGALKADGIDGPYIVVGHSLGSYESLLLKDREPSNVVGMVLVDPSYPGQFDEMARTLPAEWAYAASHPDPSLAHMQKCAAEVLAGTVWRGKPDPDGCMTPSRPAVLPAELLAALDAAEFGAGPQSYAARLEAQAASQVVTLDSRLVIKSDRNYGDMPLIVLTAGVDYPLPADAPAQATAETPTRRVEWLRAHDALAALSTRGVNRTVPDSAHYIHQLRPLAVVDAIDEVVDEARGSAGRQAGR